MSKYGPISLLTSFSQSFEAVIQTKILKHLTKYNMLSAEQNGFRIGLKIDNAIYKLTTEKVTWSPKRLCFEPSTFSSICK